MWRKLLADIGVAVGHYDTSDEDELLCLLDAHMEVFERPVPACLLHMDVWHQKILVDEVGNLTGQVDWDRALWGDAEIEFAVLDYCSISQPAFWEGYGKVRAESPSAATCFTFCTSCRSTSPSEPAETGTGRVQSVTRINPCRWHGSSCPIDWPPGPRAR